MTWRNLLVSVLLCAGLPMVIGGVSLIYLGGSCYFGGAGIALIGSALLLAAGRSEVISLYGTFLWATLVWSIYEGGSDCWSLATRLAMPWLLGLWVMSPSITRTLSRKTGGRSRRMAIIAIVGTISAIGAGVALRTAFVVEPSDPLYQAGTIADLPVARVDSRALAGDDGNWPAYGNDAGGTRFSRLSQINSSNVGRLRQVWSYDLGPNPGPGKLEVTPIEVGSTLYACTGFNDVIALDAETGKLRWRFDAHVDPNGILFGNCRGVAYHHAPNAAGECADRIVTATVDARLLAIDATTGQPCRNFGDHGSVSLLKGMSPAPKGYYYVTSAPTIVRGNIVIGGWVYDGQRWGEPSGVIRAYDVGTGRFVWALDVGRPNQHGEPSPGTYYTHSTPNSWAPMSADEKLGLVYAPTGSPVPDYYGVLRRPFDEAYSSAVLAIDARNGAIRWTFQTVRHDLWDYDVASQPTLVDIRVSGQMRPGMIQATKRGEIFVLDRRTGLPILPVAYHAAPRGGTVAGERPASAQPFSDAMPSFRGPDLTEADMWGLTPLDQLWCRIRFRQARYQGTLTPPGITPNIASPGFLGGSDWGGVAIDPDRKLLIVNSNLTANYDRLVPREDATRLRVLPMGYGPSDARRQQMQAQGGTPYAIKALAFLSPLSIPCQRPPYGRISAIDLDSHKLLWTHPLGTADHSGPFNVPSTLPLRIGTPNMGGAVATGGGIFFIGATQDRKLRAFETMSGRMVWSARLPAGSQASPMTYKSPASGRQFVAIASGGHPLLGAQTENYIVAFALPKVSENTR